MRWQEEVFGPLLVRTVENAQVQHLAEHYDLARDSRLAQAIVRHVNEVLDAEEKRRQVKRVRPGELLLRTHRGYLVLALRTPEDIARVVAGERLDKVRGDILERAKAQYRELFPEASRKNVERFLRCIWPGCGPRGKTPSALWGPRQKRPWADTPNGRQPLVDLDAEQGRRWVDRDPPRPRHLPETFEKLAHFLGNQAGIPPAIQEPMILDLMAIRARFCPRLTTMASGQMPLVAMHVKSGRHLWQPSRYQPMASVVVTLLANKERYILSHKPLASYDEFLEFHGRRMARVLTEAYTQDGPSPLRSYSGYS